RRRPAAAVQGHPPRRGVAVRPGAPGGGTPGGPRNPRSPCWGGTQRRPGPFPPGWLFVVVTVSARGATSRDWRQLAAGRRDATGRAGRHRRRTGMNAGEPGFRRTWRTGGAAVTVLVVATVLVGCATEADGPAITAIDEPAAPETT